MFLWALFCVCSLRFPRCARREMCVLSDGETIECGPLVVRSDCENKSSGTERVGSLESDVPSEAISYERTRTLLWKQSGCDENPHLFKFRARITAEVTGSKNTQKTYWMQLYIHGALDTGCSPSSRCASRCRYDNRQVLARCVLKLHRHSFWRCRMCLRVVSPLAWRNKQRIHRAVS